MSGTYGKVKTPGSKFTVAVFCFPTLSHSLKAAVRRDFPEPAVPIIKTMNIQTPFHTSEGCSDTRIFNHHVSASSLRLIATYDVRKVDQNRFFDGFAD